MVQIRCTGCEGFMNQQCEMGAQFGNPCVAAALGRCDTCRKFYCTTHSGAVVHECGACGAARVALLNVNLESRAQHPQAVDEAVGTAPQIDLDSINRRAHEIGNQAREAQGYRDAYEKNISSSRQAQDTMGVEVAALCQQFRGWATRHHVPFDTRGFIGGRGWRIAEHVYPSDSDYHPPTKLTLWVFTSGDIKVLQNGKHYNTPVPELVQLSAFHGDIADGIARHVAKAGIPWP
jgi:hypothetical protein